MEPRHTTLFVRQALDGDDEGLRWVVERFSPLLLSQARMRLADGLQGLYDPEDLVSEVWCITLPRLPDLDPRDGRHTPVLVAFLSRTLTLRVRTLVKKHLEGKPLKVSGGPADADPLAAIPEEVAGTVTRIVHAEAGSALHSRIQALPEAYRQVMILRGIEQLDNQEVADELGLEPNTVAVRFKRAKDLLRDGLPEELRELFDAVS